MVDVNFLAGQASIWVQPNGPNTKPIYLGCHGAGDIEESKGDVTLLYCPDPAAAGKYVVKNSFQGAPDPVSFTLDTDVRKVADYLETVQFQIPIFIHKVQSGRRDDFTNFERSFILRQCRITKRTLGNLASRNPDDEDESTQSFEMASLELLRVFNLSLNRVTISETNTINSIAVGGEDREESAANARQSYGDIVVAVCNRTGATTANVLVTKNAGTPTATAADPLSTSEDIQGVVVFKVGKNTTRILVGLGTTRAGGPCVVSYSDDYGATWTSRTLGATNGEFIQNGHALFALDARNIWAGTSAGNIYYSQDGGVNWTKQTATVLGSAVVAINFYDANTGYALLTSGNVEHTVDGGTTWGAVTASGTSGTGTDIHALTRYLVYVSASDGLYYSSDAGATWTNRNAVATAALDFKNEQEGLAVGSGASALVYQTVDGGYTWNALTLVTNSGYSDVKWVNSQKALVAGAANGGTGFYGSLSPAA
jgi:photosystem II stability/assembly factor-like uncharacterized protein